jgi:hypothetical protein
LGLGDLKVKVRERCQPPGGRCDFLMSDPDGDMRYEVEVMLGQTDPSHIIRCIEYWDVERTRWPDSDHRAVIVAEEITSRFFNVIRLLNRAVPIIAIQFGVLQFEDRVILNFTKVLDISELSGGEEDEQSGDAEQADRAYWAQSHPNMLRVADRLIGLIPEPTRRVTYNKGHIALSTSGNQFAWFHYRTNAPYCVTQLRMDEEEQPQWVAKLAESGISPKKKGKYFSIGPTEEQLSEHEGLIREVLMKCEELSR